MINLQKKHTRLGWNGRFLKLTLLSILIMAAITLPSSAAPAEVTNQLPAAQAVGPAWVFQGPAPQLGGPAQDLANIAEPDEPVSGAVVAIAASPTDPNLVYLGAAGGGVWKTTNAGASWEHKAPELTIYSTGAIAQSQSNPDVFYVGTGMGYGRVVELVGNEIGRAHV